MPTTPLSWPAHVTVAAQKENNPGVGRFGLAQDGVFFMSSSFHLLSVGPAAAENNSVENPQNARMRSTVTHQLFSLQPRGCTGRFTDVLAQDGPSC